jgi:hypothetical protein
LGAEHEHVLARVDVDGCAVEALGQRLPVDGDAHRRQVVARRVFDREHQ